LQEIEKTAEVLRRVSNFLRTLTDDQVDDLISGRVRLTLTNGPSRKSLAKRRDVAALDINHLREDLTAKSTREEGIDLLESLGLTRESLREIATAMDLPTPKTDTVARLKDRIVEATIGYRLRSSAIRSGD
jgi:hypothetical protein